MNNTQNDLNEEVKKPTRYWKAKLKEMGFTEKLIDTLLPEPVRKRMDIPGWYCLLWEAKDVEEAMKDPAFLRKQKSQKKNPEQRKKASERMKERIKKEYKKTMAIAEEVISEFEAPIRIPLDELEDKTLNDRAKCYYGVDCYSSCCPYYDDETLKRWMVNYIRHKMTNYEDLIEEVDMWNTIGGADAYNEFKYAVYTKIKSVYPELAEECDRQMNRKSRPCSMVSLDDEEEEI